ncbi:Ensconsin (Microtubule associated protein 7) [Fasciola gigantica]|uniref:Ensconsin (Microtubule associated protein 7) n=1 Tax=Fasciola gigantica TaxID=46835 RepID=A0A504YW71_FASGI|nr:Ensconsin (Microtubule associated protein 7) [Fasciola gigantica]
MRAAEELKQQQRYAAFIESQRQADLVRMRAQEERKRKIEEMRQREEARRALVLERRKELELSNKARIEGLRERSRARDGSIHNPRRRATVSVTTLGRTASASPSLGSARNPNQLMTTSCVVAFGSSAPRSICTQLSPAALRLQQAFEARIASYLTGRHSGCFLTSSALPHYMRLIDHNDRVPRTASAITFLANRQRRAKQSDTSTKLRRAASAHVPLTRPTKASMARTQRVNAARKQTEPVGSSGDSASYEVSTDTGKPVTQDRLGTSGPPHLPESPKSDEVSGRSSSSQECNKLGRPPRAPISSVSSQPDVKPAKTTLSESNNHSAIGSARSISVDTLSRRPVSTRGVFERLARTLKNREKAVPVEITKNAPKTQLASTQSKKPTAPRSSSTKRTVATAAPSKPMPRGMSASLYADRTEPKRPLFKSSTVRKRSVSPPITLATTASVEPITMEPLETAAEPTVPEESPEMGKSGTEISAHETLAPRPIPSPEPVEPVEGLSNPESIAAAPPIPSIAPTHAGPIKAETRGAGEGGVLNESEAAIYRAKLVEQRRLAKERKEEEQRRLEEENRQRRMQQEAARLAAEQAAREQAERAAQEAAEQQRQREEEERAKLEAAEAERLAKLQRAEEERIMRKKKLDSIMSRVKHTQNLATASSPSLLSQDELSLPLVHSDASDSKLFAHESPSIPDDVVPANSTDTLDADAPETQMRTDTFTTPLSSSDQADDVETNNTPLAEFSLPVESDVGHTEMTTDVLPGKELTRNSKGDVSESSPRLSTDSNHEGINGDHATLHADELSSSPGSPRHNGITKSINRSTSQGDIQSDNFASEQLSGYHTLNGATTVGTTIPEAPRFKSALLQSMLGGGRLSTRAKDAVAGLRRGSANQTSDTLSLNSRDGSGAHSPVYWPQNPIGGCEFASSRFQTSSRESLKYGSGFDSHGAVSMVRSMFDGSADRYHINGSSVPGGPSGDMLDLNSTESSLLNTDTAKPNGTETFAWQATADPDLAAPESMSPRPVHMSTN